MIPDPNAAPVSLRSGDVDVAPIYPDQLVSIEGVRGLRVLETPENATIWITMQLSRPPANARNVRLAVAHAIDMATIRDVFHGLYPQAGSFLPPVLRPWHDRAIKPYAYDLRAARALLHGRTIDVQLAVENLGIFMRLATVLQEQLARAGIRATIKEFPIALYNAPDGPIRNARFTLTIDGWLGGADPEQSIIFLCSQANPDGDNSGRYCDPAFEALFRDQQRTRSPLRRLADFRAMQRLIHDRIAVIPLYYEVYFDGLSDRVRGFSRNMLRYPVSPEVWDVP